MKKILPLISCIAMLQSCKPSSEEKAKNLIKEELRLTLHDLKSYEPVQFGKLDSAFSSASEDPIYLKESEAFDKADKDFKENLSNEKIYLPLSSFSNKYLYYRTLADQDIKQMKFSADRLDSLKKYFKPTFTGLCMKHSYRAKSLNGNFGIHHYIYYFDSSLTKIMREKDIGENAIDK